jgi:hypothetical protein
MFLFALPSQRLGASAVIICFFKNVSNAHLTTLPRNPYDEISS